MENGGVEVRPEPEPRRDEGWAVVRVLLAGICNTDLELRRGYYGFAGTPGHEFAGEVVDGGPAWLGKRVVGEINIGCRDLGWPDVCAACAAGHNRHCTRRSVLGIVRHPGAFAEFLTLPERNLWQVPDNVSTEHAIFCEPLAAALRLTAQTPVGAGGEVAVLGDGKLGLLIAQALRAKGADVTLFGRHPGKMRIARGVRGIVGRDTLPERQFPVVVDATGTAEGLRAAVAMTRPQGVLVMKSTVHGAVEIDTAPVIVNELTLIGSRCGDFGPALAMLAAGQLNLDPMLSDQFDLADAPRAFDRAAEKGVLKVLLRP